MYHVLLVFGGLEIGGYDTLFVFGDASLHAIISTTYLDGVPQATRQKVQVLYIVPGTPVLCKRQGLCIRMHMSYCTSYAYA